MTGKVKLLLALVGTIFLEEEGRIQLYLSFEAAGGDNETIRIEMNFSGFSDSSHLKCQKDSVGTKA